MNKPKHNLTDQVRRTILRAGAAGITTTEICEALDMVFPADKKKVHGRINDLLTKSKEIERLGRAAYRFRQFRLPPQEKSGAQKIWDLLRLRQKHGKPVTTDDLVSLCGVSNQYARQKMRFFTKLGITKKSGPSAWRMITDPVKMPDDRAAAEKLKQLRAEKKKKCLAALDALIAATVDARMAIVTFNDSTEDA